MFHGLSRRIAVHDQSAVVVAKGEFARRDIATGLAEFLGLVRGLVACGLQLVELIDNRLVRFHRAQTAE
ncbi:hypothetical protein D3C81_2274670 [compost metagenome]